MIFYTATGTPAHVISTYSELFLLDMTTCVLPRFQNKGRDPRRIGTRDLGIKEGRDLGRYVRSTVY